MAVKGFDRATRRKWEDPTPPGTVPPGTVPPGAVAPGAVTRKPTASSASSAPSTMTQGSVLGQLGFSSTDELAADFDAWMDKRQNTAGAAPTKGQASGQVPLTQGVPTQSKPSEVAYPDLYKLAGQVANRQAWAYDPKKVINYDQLKEEYGQRAQVAREHAESRARDGAMGWGSSYAALAGNMAYDDVMDDFEPDMMALDKARYDSETQLLQNGYSVMRDFDDWLRKQEAAKEEKAKAAENEQKAAEDAQRSLMTSGMQYAMKEYNGYNEDSIRKVLTSRGISEQEADEIVRTVVADHTKYLNGQSGYGTQGGGTAGGYSLGEGYNAEEANALFSILMSQDGVNGMVYNGTNKATLRSVLVNLGYSEAAVDEAFRRVDDVESATVTDTNNYIMDAINSGDYAGIQSLSGIPEEEWSDMSPDEQRVEAMEVMGQQKKRGNDPEGLFIKTLSSDMEERIGEIAGDGANVKNIRELSDIVATWLDYVDKGYMTEEEAVTLAKQLDEETGFVSFVNKSNENSHIRSDIAFNPKYEKKDRKNAIEWMQRQIRGEIIKNTIKRPNNLVVQKQGSDHE